jgi:hypothetical protein
MTPKDKAKQLKEKFSAHMFSEIKGWFENEEESKQNAIMVCDEILEVIDKTMQGWVDTDIISYWQDVKQEIQNL